MAKIIAASGTKAKLASPAREAFISRPDQFAALPKADIARILDIIKTASIKADG